NEPAFDFALGKLEVVILQQREQALDALPGQAAPELDARLDAGQKAQERFLGARQPAQLPPERLDELPEIGAHMHLTALFLKVQALVILLVFQDQEGRESAGDAELLAQGNREAVQVGLV